MASCRNGPTHGQGLPGLVRGQLHQGLPRPARRPRGNHALLILIRFLGKRSEKVVGMLSRAVTKVADTVPVPWRIQFVKLLHTECAYYFVSETRGSAKPESP